MENNIPPPSKKTGKMAKFYDYEGFVEKFKPKKTTDDCYTPPHVYEAVKNWALEHCDVPEGARIVRPFYPGGDYENFDYQPGDVVIDNPPFSLSAQIRCFYESRGIPYFLFAPHLTLISGCKKGAKTTFIVTHAGIIYDNGAHVVTDFATNMWRDDDLLVVRGDLHKIIDEVQRRHRVDNPKRNLPKYAYPPQVVHPAGLGKIAVRGIQLRFPREECELVSALDSQRAKGKGIFGKGFFVSERLAAERLAAQEVTVWELSEREKEIVRRLSEN